MNACAVFLQLLQNPTPLRTKPEQRTAATKSGKLQIVTREPKLARLAEGMQKVQQ
jgi:hypothetical protein